MLKGYTTFDVTEHLHTEEEIQGFLNAMLKENNQYAYQKALEVAQAARERLKVTQ